MEVEHVGLLETDVAAEVLADNALPRGEEVLVEQLLQILRQVHVLELGGALGSLLHEFDRSQAKIYSAETQLAS